MMPADDGRQQRHGTYHFILSRRSPAHVMLHPKSLADLALSVTANNAAAGRGQHRKDSVVRSENSAPPVATFCGRTVSLAQKKIEQAGIVAVMSEKTDSKSDARDSVRQHDLQLRFRSRKEQ
ncbi:MAG TPA: hypothetical protein VIF60_08600 [Burkholderiaceae bacterium]|jgi:hypothetical protein